MSSSFFFFSCSAAHPDLHSFPTRRSSDLVGAEAKFEPYIDRITLTLPVLCAARHVLCLVAGEDKADARSEEHTSELQSLRHLVCRLLLEKKKKKNKTPQYEVHTNNP